jgi:predicted GH43/DUF377 family glycosyl hydrolase
VPISEVWEEIAIMCVASIKALAIATCFELLAVATEARYTLSLQKDPSPVFSTLNARGRGYTPCNYTFNPAWILPTPGTNHEAGVLLRAAQCPDDFGGVTDHILMAKCDASTGTCSDVLPTAFPFEHNSQDPRVVFDESTGYYWLFYWASEGTGQSTVFRRRSKTPFEPSSWELVGSPQPWHRNGCAFPLVKNAAPNASRYIIVGEAPNPGLPALGLWKSNDGFESFELVNASYIPANGPNSTSEPEVVVEASTPLVQLSNGDYLHLYSAGTPGWVAHGNYTAGWVVIDKEDANRIIQRSTEHILIASLPFEGVEPIHGYQVQRYRTTFVTSIVPLGGDVFRLYWGAADASVASGLLTVTTSTE